MRLIKSVLAAFVFTALAASPAVAQTGPDYIFNVPVNIANVPSLNGHRFMLECSVQARGADGAISRYSSNANIAPGADGRVQIPTYAIGPTGYQGTITAEVTLPPGVRRADAIRWSCNASFFTVTNTSGARVSMPNPSQYTPLTGQSVARSQLLVQGTF